MIDAMSSMELELKDQCCIFVLTRMSQAQGSRIGFKILEYISGAILVSPVLICEFFISIINVNMVSGHGYIDFVTWCRRLWEYLPWDRLCRCDAPVN